MLLALLSLAFLAFLALPVPSALADVGPLTLPDNRAWEQVSPVDKQGNDILRGDAVASLDGNRLMFQSLGAFAGAPATLTVGGGVYYIASRGGERWHTAPIMPQTGVTAGGANGYAGVTPDLSKGVLERYEATETIDPLAHPGGTNIYLADTASTSFLLLNTFDTDWYAGDGGFIWGSADLGKIAIHSIVRLTPEAPCPPSGSGDPHFCAYEWDHGTMRLASVLPNGEPTTGTPGNESSKTNEVRVGNIDHAVSDDGARLFFTSPTMSSPGERKLYVRDDGIETQLLSGSERTLPGGLTGQDAYFQDAEAAHGDRVLFTTKNTLVNADQDETNDLYLYDFTRPEGERLTLISEDNNPEAPEGASVNDAGSKDQHFGGLVGASENLRRVYFAADNQIVPGEPSEPGPKLYLWEDTGASPHVAYIGTLLSGDEAWRSPAEKRQSRVGADGRFLLFLSSAKLTEFENEGSTEAYLYDAATGSLQCASCSADAFPAEGNLAFNSNTQAAFSLPEPRNHTLNNVTESGRVFFQTTRGLVPRDSNGKLDVYEYEDGALRLISTGTGDSDSYFLDATSNGSDVFFVTRDRLVGWDKDELYDAYDARVNGGLPEPTPGPPPCEGDSCQPPPLVPVDPSLGSASFEGPGNAKARKARRCRAGTVRRRGRCRAKRKAHGKKETRR